MSLRFAVLGAGRIGQVHARAIASVPGAELVAIAEPFAAAAEAARKAFGCEIRTIDAILGSADIDAVVICTPTDTHADLIEKWYVSRFMQLRATAFSDPRSFFHRYSVLTDAEARETSLKIWNSINLPNLRENILPTRQRADLILHKGANHSIEAVALRKL